MTRRTFTKLGTAAAGAVVAPTLTVSDVVTTALSTDHAPVSTTTHDRQSSAPDDKLQSEFLFDLVLERGSSTNVGSVGVNRLVVAVLGGTFEGPKLRGTVVGPGGDWIVGRPDGSLVLDIRVLLKTDDNQEIYMTCRGIAYTPPGGALHARILPVFETGAAKYGWLNNVVAVGVNRSVPGKVAYRVYQIL
jgi:hypothetical protein